MSIITVLALAFITLLVVVVLAACSSFPNRSSADRDPPDGDWIGKADLSSANAATAAAVARVATRAKRLPTKMHSWI